MFFHAYKLNSRHWDTHTHSVSYYHADKPSEAFSFISEAQHRADEF